MPFTKITADEMDGALFAADMDGHATWREDLEARIAAAEAGRDGAIAELDVSGTKAGRDAQEDIDRADVEAAERALEDAQRRLDEASAAVRANRQERVGLAARVDALHGDELDTREALSREYGSDRPPELTQAEATWLAAFNQASPTPPSETMRLKGVVDAASRATQAERDALAQLDAGYAGLAAALRDAEADRDAQAEALKEATFTRNARRSSHQLVTHLEHAVEMLRLQLDGVETTAVSLVAVVLPFRRLIGDLRSEIGALAAEEHVVAQFTADVDAARATLDAQDARIEALAGLTGAAAQARLPELNEIGPALNTLADHVAAMRAEGLQNARLERAETDGEARLRAVAAQFAYGPDLLDAHLRMLREQLGRLNLSDWDTAATGVETAVRDICGLLETAALEEEAAQRERARKAEDFDANVDILARGREANVVAQRKIADLRTVSRDATTSYADFKFALDALVERANRAEANMAQRRADAEALAEALTAGHVVRVEAWRRDFGLPTEGYTMTDTTRGDYHGHAWEIHLTNSSDAILADTTRVDLRNTTRDDVYNQLLIAPIKWHQRVHASFRIESNPGAGDLAAPGNAARIYLGRGPVYMPEVIPHDMFTEVEARLRALIRAFETRAKDAIADRLQ